MKANSAAELAEAIVNAGGNINSSPHQNMESFYTGGGRVWYVEPRIKVTYWSSTKTVLVQGKDCEAFQEALQASLEMGQTSGPSASSAVPKSDLPYTDTGGEHFPETYEGVWKRKFIRLEKITWAEGKFNKLVKLVGVCDDGTLWEYENSFVDLAKGTWRRLPDIPQDEPTKEETL